jgi:hypothetical protein
MCDREARTHNMGILQVRLEVVSMGFLSQSTLAGQDKNRWAFVC